MNWKRFFRRTKKNVEKGADEIVKVEKKYRKLILTGVIIAVLLIFLLTTKAYLYTNFLLGNDIVVRLSADQENLFLANDETENITFTASTTTNPFCKATCNAHFEDLSEGNIIDEYTFEVRPGLPYQKTYSMSPQHLGEGQELYRFSMECSAVNTVLCHTADQPTKRSILVTLWHSLTPEEQALKNELQGTLENIRKNVFLTEARAEELLSVADMISVPLITEKKELTATNAIIRDLIQGLEKAEQLWNRQNYPQLEGEVNTLLAYERSMFSQFNPPNKTIHHTVKDYNLALRNLSSVHTTSKEWPTKVHDKNLSKKLNEVYSDYSTARKLLYENTEVSTKLNTAVAVAKEIEKLNSEVVYETELEALNITIHNDIFFKIICETSKICVSRNTITERAEQKIELNTACKDRETLLGVLESLNSSAISDLDSENRFRQYYDYIHYELSEQIPDGKPNTVYLKEIFDKTKNVTAPTNLSGVLESAISFAPNKCNLINLTEAPQKTDAHPITINTTELSLENVFTEPKPICCTFGVCETCCENETCMRNPKNTPVVFIHGHAFNKDTTAEYSLDGFNKIQDKLEEEGVLNLGAISLYSDRDVPYGTWGKHNAPVSIKVSYYFDIFEEPENYIIVQTKSENIDTYAIRLKELLDVVEQRTGRNDVIIVAHSMGGLVARRYVQIFGPDNVQQLVMIGTPNNGVRGSVADFCPVIGEKLECRDMQEGSLFLNKLNRELIPNIRINNIIGRGCQMDGEDGDGVVLVESAYLEGANNTYINGSCTTFEKLHTEILDPTQYPETLSVLKEILISSS